MIQFAVKFRNISCHCNLLPVNTQNFIVDNLFLLRLPAQINVLFDNILLLLLKCLLLYFVTDQNFEFLTSSLLLLFIRSVKLIYMKNKTEFQLVDWRVKLHFRKMLLGSTVLNMFFPNRPIRQSEISFEF